jgi:transcriptional regulator of PTS gene
LAVKIADPLLMREINKYHVLETIREHGQISRVEISERTLLSGTTVSAITGALIEEGLIAATHSPGGAEAQRGRPRVLLSLVGDAAYVLGIKISEAMTTVMLVDFRGEVVEEVQLPARLARQPVEVIVDLIEDIVSDCIAKSGVARARIRGIGIGVPGIVDPRSGKSYASSVFGEREIPIGTLLAERTGLPVKLEKPANLVALAEHWFGAARHEKSFAVVVLDQTASIALWLDEDLHRGASALGPAFGHIKVGHEGRRCECGQDDCLNAYVGLSAVRKRLEEAMGANWLEAQGSDLREGLAQAAEQGDNRARAQLEQQAESLGKALAHVINLVNPGKIILALDAPHYGEAILPTLTASAAANSFRAHFAATRIIAHALDDQLWARGAAALMLRDIYSAPWTTSY